MVTTAALVARRGDMSWLLLSALLAAQTASAPDERPRVIVLEFSHSADVSVDVAQTLTGLATASLHRYEQIRIVSGAELAELMELEGEKAAVGCDDDGCLAEIAGALGARFAVSGRIATLGELQVLQMRLMDVTQAEGLSRVVRNAKGLEVFVAQMDAAADELVAPALKRIAEEGGSVAPPRTEGTDSTAKDSTSGPVESAQPEPPRKDQASSPRAEKKQETDEDGVDDDSSWILTGSLIGGGLGLIGLGVLATAAITPVDFYLAFAVHPPLGLEDAIAPAVYLGSAIAIGTGVVLVFSPLFMGPDEGEGS